MPPARLTNKRATKIIPESSRVGRLDGWTVGRGGAGHTTRGAREDREGRRLGRLTLSGDRQKDGPADCRGPLFLVYYSTS